MGLRIFKKKLLLLILVLFVFVGVSQTNNKFYATIEDYQNDKAIEDFEIQAGTWEMNLGVESFKIISLGDVTRKKLENLPSSFFTYDDVLLRNYNGHCYIVLVYGNLCFYSLYNLNQKQFYSNTIAGDLKKYKSKLLKSYLVKYNLLESYQKAKPKREFTDDANSYFAKITARDVNYFRLVNGKMK